MILAFDPAQNNVGWCFFDGNIILSDTIRVKTALTGVPAWMDLQRQLSEAIVSVLGYRADEVASEFPHGAQSFAAARGLSVTSGILSGVCAARNIPLTFYTEYDVKHCLFGRKKDVTKDQMVARVIDLTTRFGYIVPEKFKTHSIAKINHEADAIAVLITHMKQTKRIS
jgi:Holliday junction resolvasome RuvABC endonuclease subunit